MEHISEEQRRMGVPDRHVSKNSVQNASGEPGPKKPTQLVEEEPVDNDGSGDTDDDEEELEDPQEVLRSSCQDTTKCSLLLDELMECNDRVNSRKKTKETCEQELYDFIGCVDSCVTKDLFKLLK